MSYDFQAAVDAAKAVVDRQENSGESKSYTYPLIYPQSGNTITVRPLFNPASGQIVRLINRHEKVPCLRSYGTECPICKTMQQVKDLTGQDPFGRTKASRSRGISFAQYISSTNQIDKGGNRGILQPGEIILFMYPWSVYQQVNTMIQAIARTPTGMDQAFCHSQTGLFIQVQVTADFKYTTTQIPYFTFPTQQTDEEFTKMLDGMESLLEQVIPSTITAEVDKQVREYNDEIHKQYIAPRVASYGVPAGTAPVNYSQQQAPVPNAVTAYNQFPVSDTTTTTPAAYGSVPVAPSSTDIPPFNPPYSNVVPGAPMTGTPVYPQAPATSTAPQTTPVGLSEGQKPSCMGNHAMGSPRCICCPEEMNCMSMSGGE